MARAGEARGGRASPTYRIEHAESVLYRDDQIFAKNLDELMELFRSMMKVLEELGFQEVREAYSEHWSTLPFKNGVDAWQWKDPFTAIHINVSARVKEPRSDRKTAEDVYKVKVRVKADVTRTTYPHQEWFEETTIFKRSVIYRWLHKVLGSFLFRKDLEKYEEEAEELALEFVSRMREIEGSMPAIGRSAREWYNPAEER